MKEDSHMIMKACGQSHMHADRFGQYTQATLARSFIFLPNRYSEILKDFRAARSGTCHWKQISSSTNHRHLTEYAETQNHRHHKDVTRMDTRYLFHILNSPCDKNTDIRMQNGSHSYYKTAGRTGC